MGFGSQNSQAMSSCRLSASSSFCFRISRTYRLGTMLAATEITPWAPKVWRAECASSSLPDQHDTPCAAYAWRSAAA